MRELPQHSVIRLDHTDGYERVVMAHPTSLSARIGIRTILACIAAVAAYFWIDALLSILRGSWGFDEAMALLFTTLVFGFLLFMGRFAFRSRIPESIVVADGGLIHDSGVDSFRMSNVEKDNHARQSERFVTSRIRVHFSARELATLSQTNLPYPNRIYVETPEGRHDIGEALSAEERAWLY